LLKQLQQGATNGTAQERAGVKREHRPARELGHGQAGHLHPGTGQGIVHQLP
jgi:hypothetical protein